MEWGNAGFCQRHEEDFDRREGSHKEPMNGAADGNIGSGASSGFAC